MKKSKIKSLLLVPPLFASITTECYMQKNSLLLHLFRANDSYVDLPSARKRWSISLLLLTQKEYERMLRTLKIECEAVRQSLQRIVRNILLI